jgi:hypothetical protein
MKKRWWWNVGVLVIGGVLVGWWWKEVRSRRVERFPVEQVEVGNKRLMEEVVVDEEVALGVETSEVEEEQEGEVLSKSEGGWVEAGGKLGIVVEDYANRHGGLSGLESKLGKQIATVSIYKQFGLEFNDQLVLTDLEYIGNSGKKLMVAWEPWDPREGMGQSRDYLVEITSGGVDGYINEFINRVVTYGNPVVVRFGHEMNGNWYPWGGRPEEYVRAYRYVVDKFRERGVGNVRFMWSINAESVPVEPISEVGKYYPGDGYVDVIGIDGFNFGTAREGMEWRSFEEIFWSAYEYLASTYSISIVVSEVASAEEGGSKVNWINEMFVALDNRFAIVDEVVWFNLLKEADWRVESTDQALKSFRNNL